MSLERSEAPEDARALPAITQLRRTWQRHYECRERSGSATEVPPVLRVRFKANRDLPSAAEGVDSSDDTDARYHHTRDTQWTGYLVHIRKTCERAAPYLLTHVHTPTAAVHEARWTAPLQQAMAEQDLLPSEHLVDAAYIDAERLVAWLNERPRAKTRISRFGALMPI